MLVAMPAQIIEVIDDHGPFLFGQGGFLFQINQRKIHHASRAHDSPRIRKFVRGRALEVGEAMNWAAHNFSSFVAQKARFNGVDL